MFFFLFGVFALSFFFRPAFLDSCFLADRCGLSTARHVTPFASIPRIRAPTSTHDAPTSRGRVVKGLNN